MPPAPCCPRSGWRQAQPEIPSLPVLLEPLDLDRVVVTADAMHTQVDTAEWIVGRGGHYPLTPLGNQKTYSQGPAVEERPVHLLGRHRTRTAGAAHRQYRRDPHLGGLPGAAQVVQFRHTPGPSRAGGTLKWSTGSAPYSCTTPNPKSSPPGLRRQSRYRLDHQTPVKTPQTSYQTTNPTNHLNQLCQLLDASCV